KMHPRYAIQWRTVFCAWGVRMNWHFWRRNRPLKHNIIATRVEVAPMKKRFAACRKQAWGAGRWGIGNDGLLSRRRCGGFWKRHVLKLNNCRLHRWERLSILRMAWVGWGMGWMWRGI